MNLRCQNSSLEELHKLALSDRHSVLIEGVSGCGKTYLAKQYSKMLNISDFVNVKSNVNDIRKSIDMCYSIESRVVVCIENLDSGVSGASYTLLKFLEEPRSNIYIVVTCCNIHKVPDTIISRSSLVTVSSPTEYDLDLFLSQYSDEKQKLLRSNTGLMDSIRNFKDIDYCTKLESSYCDYLENLVTFISSKKPVSDIVWSLGHYPDGTEIPLQFSIKYIVSNTTDSGIKKKGIRCIKELDSSRLSSHAVLSRFVMDCKWGD